MKRIFIGSLIALLGSSGFVFISDAGAQPKIKHDPNVEVQLRTLFNRYDLNKDGFLDAEEVAKAYRGPTAKPAPQPGFDSKGNFVAPASSSGYKYPDQVFMLAADRNGDNRVSWDEYDVYGESIVLRAKNQAQAMRAAYARAQRNLAVRRNIAYSRSARAHHRPVARHHRRWR